MIYLPDFLFINSRNSEKGYDKLEGSRVYVLRKDRMANKDTCN